VKTLAIRLEDEFHAQLSVLAQLRNSTITEEIRTALEKHLEQSKTSGELSSRAQAVLEDIERESKARQAAIASLFGEHQQETAAVVPLKAGAQKTSTSSSPGRKGQ
jgi:predicted DNA-binding protein